MLRTSKLRFRLVFFLSAIETKVAVGKSFRAKPAGQLESYTAWLISDLIKINSVKVDSAFWNTR